MSTTKVILLAAGLGKRLRPLTNTTPKCLVNIDGRPLLDYWFARLRAAGVNEVLINTHHLRGQVQEYIKSINSCKEFKVVESYEPNLLGSAGTIHNNREFADDAENVLIIYADNLSSIDLNDLLLFHDNHTDPFTIVLFQTQNPRDCGIASIDCNGRVIDFVEKPRTPKGNLANAGIYIVSSEAYREIADMTVFDIAFDVLPRFVGRMRAFVFNGYHRDIGSRSEYELAKKEACGWHPK